VNKMSGDNNMPGNENSNATCHDRDRIFEDGTPAEWAALETHAAGCALCAEELRAWKSLSVAAAQLRDYAPSPMVWSRIQAELAANAPSPKQSAAWWDRSSAWLGFRLSWQLAAAGAFALVLLASGGWLYRSQIKHAPTAASHDSLLKTKALGDVEHAQTAYIQAIDKLAADAKPQLDCWQTIVRNFRCSTVLSMICARRPARIHPTPTCVTNCSLCIRKNSKRSKMFWR
jgi:hypothetical protein